MIVLFTFLMQFFLGSALSFHQELGDLRVILCYVLLFARR